MPIFVNKDRNDEYNRSVESISPESLPLRRELSLEEKDAARRYAVKHATNRDWLSNGHKITKGYERVRMSRRTLEHATAEELVPIFEAGLRGFWGERLSAAVPIESAETVYISPFLSGLEVKHLSQDPVPYIELNKNAVEEVVSEVGKSKHTLYNIHPDEGVVVPDGLLASENGLIGVVEVKSYTKEEVEILKNGLKENFKNWQEGKLKLGASSITQVEYAEREMRGNMILGSDIVGEINFLEKVLSSQPDSQKMSTPQKCIVLLRFLDDTPDELLQELGELTDKLGNRYGYDYQTVIQKLPFTAHEIDYLAKKIVVSDLEKIKNNTLIESDPSQKIPFFTERDQRVYSLIAQESVSTGK